ncbi:neuromedin-U receptor 1-like [Cydia amplana]|uniref:neuromedin-U receptor 1-like n=1 Tax=Cydia amplana TaxID=1869771 RepID=UPI002FE620DC
MQAFVRALSARLIDATGDPRAGAHFSQRIALAVQRGNAASVMGTMPQADLLDGPCVVAEKALAQHCDAASHIAGLAPELWYYWQMYPYIFGEFTCRLTNFLRATATWASALTVVAFSIERYTAICHHCPSRSRDRRRVAMAILAIWGVSVATALPAVHVHHVVTNPVVVYPGTGKVPSLTQLCRVPGDDQYKYYNHMYATTCALFFFIPMALLMLVYIKIAVFIRSHRQQARNDGIRTNCSEDNKVFKVLGKFY